MTWKVKWVLHLLLTLLLLSSDHCHHFPLQMLSVVQLVCVMSGGYVRCVKLTVKTLKPLLWSDGLSCSLRSVKF